MSRRGRVRGGLLSIWAVTVAGGSLAHAQSVKDEPGMVSLPFTLTDRVDGTSSGDIQLGLTYFSENDQVYGFKTNAFAEGFSKSGVGFYGNMPFSAAFTTAGEGDSVFGLGNFEAGTAYARRAGQAAFLVRGGLTAPTASSGDDGVLANVISGFGRVSDLALIAPKISYARVSASGVLLSGNAFARADLGFDVPVWHGDEVSDPNTLTHVTLGVGTALRPGGTSFTAEFSSVSGSGDSMSTMALGVGFEGGVYLSLVTPLDEEARGEVAVLSLGFRFGAGSSHPIIGGPSNSAEVASSAHSTSPERGAQVEDAPPGCAARIDEWRSERDAVRKTHLYDKMPKACQQWLSRSHKQP